MSAVVLSLGSNQGESLAILQGCVAALNGIADFTVRGISGVYRTAPVGYANQPDYMNLCLLADTSLPPLKLLNECQSIEQAFGRRRDPDLRFGPRTLDIDLIDYGGQLMESKRLTLPHPRAHERAFVLVPWLELDPAAALPQGRVAELLSRLDISGVDRIPDKSVKIS